ncbi:hypothetical protein E2C01_098753 [Portunus trituberculatus]|uniref:Uncharacterized protein n=1 Tax=Portunus trituberculatus TaxID=210409 RepID=A0A5B7K7R8_PORTR|nr:hypothetical protein [Portunus trituberculatus]
MEIQRQVDNLVTQGVRNGEKVESVLVSGGAWASEVEVLGITYCTFIISSTYFVHVFSSRPL